MPRRPIPEITREHRAELRQQGLGHTLHVQMEDRPTVSYSLLKFLFEKVHPAQTRMANVEDLHASVGLPMELIDSVNLETKNRLEEEFYDKTGLHMDIPVDPGYVSIQDKEFQYFEHGLGQDEHIDMLTQQLAGHGAFFLGGAWRGDQELGGRRSIKPAKPWFMELVEDAEVPNTEPDAME